MTRDSALDGQRGVSDLDHNGWRKIVAQNGVVAGNQKSNDGRPVTRGSKERPTTQGSRHVFIKDEFR